MGIEEAPCMKGGTDETSYTNNSLLQRSIISKVRPLLEESIRAVIVSITANSPEQCLTIADLGCSSGPNTLAVLESIIDVTLSTCNDLGRPIPEFSMLVNDLPQNDFNTVFKSLPGFYQKIKEEKGIETGCFVSGTPGSFHGRLFPTKSIHFIHSSSSLHFLSQIPKGLSGGGSICTNQSTPVEFVEAYREQFAEDLNMFLKCRSKEIVDGGRMLLTLPCTHDGQSFPVMDLINHVLNKIAAQGLIDEKELKSFNLQVYMPNTALVKQVIEEEGSFVIDKEDTFSLTYHDAITTSSSSTSLHVDIPYTAKFITNTLRAGFENTLATKFGEDIVDIFFSQVRDMVVHGLNNGQEFANLCFALSLIKE